MSDYKDDFDANEWGNIGPDSILDPKWNFKRTKAQIEANKKRNRDRWANMSAEEIEQWSIESGNRSRKFWASATDEFKKENGKRIKEARWDKLSPEERKEQTDRLTNMNRDPAIKKRIASTRVANGVELSSTIKLKIYKKCLTPMRFDRKQPLYKDLSIEYNTPEQTIQHIANNFTPLLGITDTIHAKNIAKVQKQWDKICAKKQAEIDQLQQERHDRKFWFYWEVISPGKDQVVQYDYYNNLRIANQKMPVPPSVVYYVREQGMNAMEIKEYCKINKIYESNDKTYWYKSKKHPYPWYSTNNAITQKFETSKELLTFLEQTFDIKHLPKSDGMQTQNTWKGWIIRKVKKG